MNKLPMADSAGLSPSSTPTTRTVQFLNWVEGRARQLRDRCGLGAFQALDPFHLANVMQVLVVDPHEVADVPGALEQLLVAGCGEWSAGTIHPPGTPPLVVLNPTHNPQRQRATLMEELSHVFLKHPPSKLMVLNGNLTIRTYKSSHETQAYFVGAAALLPRHVLKGAITRRMTRVAVATQQGVSNELVEFREKLLRLPLAQERMGEA